MAKDIIKTSTIREIGERNCLFLAHTNQIIAIFRLLSIGFKNRDKLYGSLLQFPSGEGKSYMIAITMAVLAFLGYEVTCMCQNDFLKNRYSDEFSFLFKQLDSAGPYSKHANYHSLESYSTKLLIDAEDFYEKLSDTLTGENSYEPLKNATDQKNKILLFDEVDTIFTEAY